MQRWSPVIEPQALIRFFIVTTGVCRLFGRPLADGGPACGREFGAFTHPPLHGDRSYAHGSHFFQELVLGADFDSALDTIKATEGDTVKLTLFRGPTTFLYGPTAPSPEWYASTLL